MKNKRVVTSVLLAGILALAIGGSVFAQTPVYSNRVAQQVVIGGQRAEAVYVLAQGGGIQSYTCPAPQQYATPDGASQGWACFDSTTGVWLLSALPPQQQAPAPVVVQQVIQQPVIYQTPVYQPPVVYRYEVVQPTIIYREPPRIIYSAPAYYPRVVERGYSSSAIVGAAAINAAGRIAAAVIYDSHNPHNDHRNDRNVRVVQNNGHRR